MRPIPISSAPLPENTIRCHQCHGIVRIVASGAVVDGPCPFCQTLLSTRMNLTTNASLPPIPSAVAPAPAVPATVAQVEPQQAASVSEAAPRQVAQTQVQESAAQWSAHNLVPGLRAQAEIPQSASTAPVYGVQQQQVAPRPVRQAPPEHPAAASSRATPFQRTGVVKLHNSTGKDVKVSTLQSTAANRRFMQKSKAADFAEENSPKKKNWMLRAFGVITLCGLVGGAALIMNEREFPAKTDSAADEPLVSDSRP